MITKLLIAIIAIGALTTISQKTPLFGKDTSSSNSSYASTDTGVIAKIKAASADTSVLAKVKDITNATRSPTPVQPISETKPPT